jgi:hypothetical protein
MFARPLGRLRSDLALRPFPERLSGICLEQANTLRSSPDRRPPLSERESQNNHVPWASNLSMKFIVFLAAPHMGEMPFLQSCDATEYALAATHSEVLPLYRQTNRIRCQPWTVPLEEPSYRRVYTQDPCQIYESSEKLPLQYVTRNQVVKLPRRTTKTEKLASTFDASFTLYFINFKRRAAFHGPAPCSQVNLDGFEESPSAALRFVFRHCSELLCTPHSSTCLLQAGIRTPCIWSFLLCRRFC